MPRNVYPFSFFLFMTIPVIQYFQFLQILPHFNITILYILGLALLLLAFGTEWLRGEHRFTTWAGALAAGTLGLIVAQQLLWWPEFSRVGAAGVFQENTALTAFLPVALLLTGLGAARHAPSTRVVSAGAGLYVLAAVVGVITNFQETGLTVIKFVDYSSGVKFNYLNLADSCAILFIVLLNRLKSRPAPYLISFTLGVATLLSTFSRTSLMIFILVALLQIVRMRTLRHWGLLLIGLWAGVILAFFSAIQESENYSRVSSLLNSPETDTSFVGRADISAERFAKLADHLWLGQYMAEWWDSGTRGGYIHNVLSYLDSYGVVAFLVLCVTLVSVLFQAQRQPPERREVFWYALLAVLFARSYIWPYIWLAVGMGVGLSPSPTRTIREEPWPPEGAPV